MELDFVDELLNVAGGVSAAHIDHPVMREAFVSRPTTQDRAVTELEAHLHRLSIRHSASR